MSLESFPIEEHDESRDSLAEFTRTSLEFATYHPRYHFESFEVELVLEGAHTTRCGVTATSPELGTISVGVLGRGEFDAVARACVLLESEVDRRIAVREAGRVVAARTAVSGSRSLAGAPIPTAATWGIA